MANHTTGAQRYNKRLDNIFDTWRKDREDKLKFIHDKITDMELHTLARQYGFYS